LFAIAHPNRMIYRVSLCGTLYIGDQFQKKTEQNLKKKSRWHCVKINVVRILIMKSDRITKYKKQSLEVRACHMNFVNFFVHSLPYHQHDCRISRFCWFFFYVCSFSSVDVNADRVMCVTIAAFACTVYTHRTDWSLMPRLVVERLTYGPICMCLAFKQKKYIIRGLNVTVSSPRITSSTAYKKKRFMFAETSNETVTHSEQLHKLVAKFQVLE
jgi:hypothetical protein